MSPFLQWFYVDPHDAVELYFDFLLIVLSVTASAAFVYVLIRGCKMILQNIKGSK